MPLRHWLLPLLLVSSLLMSCGDSAVRDDQLLLDVEPPTPPPLDGVDATHLIDAFPQEPVREGEVWIRPGSVSNLVKKQKPPEPEAAPPAEPSPPSEEAVVTPPQEPLGARAAANKELIAETAAPVPRPPPAAEAHSAPPASPAPPAAAAAPTQKPAPAEASASPAEKTPALQESNNLKVAKAALATRIENRQPIGVSDTFTEGSKVYLFNTILNPDGAPILIHHKWYRGEELAASVKLSIKAARWRTWSVIPVYGKGAWRVDIVEPSGRIIHSEKFTVN